MKWIKKIWLSVLMLFLFYLPASSKPEGKDITARVNFVRKSLHATNTSPLVKSKVEKLAPHQFRKDWVNWNNWGNWANWNNWNNWKNWNNWANWGNWGNY